MSKNAEKPKLGSFQELSNVFENELDLSDDDLIDVKDEAVAAESQERKETKKRIIEWVPSRLAFLDRVAAADEDEQKPLQKKVTAIQIREELNKLLEHKDEAFRRTAWFVYLDYQFKRDLQSQAEVEELLARLVKDKRLVAVDQESDSVFKAYARFYAFPDVANFGDTERQQIRRTILDLLNRVFKAETHGDISWEELLLGKPGSMTVGVPPEQIRDDNGDLTPNWRPGCQLRIRSNGKAVWPMRINTTNEKLHTAITAASKGDVFLFLKALGSPIPPPVTGPDRELGRKVPLLYHLMRRGMAAEAGRRLRQYLKKEMARRATVSATDFFPNGQPGICLVDLSDQWEHKDSKGLVLKTYYDVFFLVSRTRETEGDKIVRQIVFEPDNPDQVPEHLQEYLAPCKGTFPEGEKFYGVPFPLIGILQHAFSQAAKAATINGGNHNG